tara:strand:- start:75 stop:338 length:264 start_codon:yes stop_codon:yes gene_type:complete
MKCFEQSDNRKEKNERIRDEVVLESKQIMKITNNAIDIVQKAFNNFEKKGIVVTNLQIDGKKKFRHIRILFDELVKEGKKSKRVELR